MDLPGLREVAGQATILLESDSTPRRFESFLIEAMELL
jgi:hypothetical protein